MKSLAHPKGSELILDLGTGAGYVSIGFAKQLDSGFVVGVDKYDQSTSILGNNFFEELKINFFGNTLNRAKKNASIEKQLDSIALVKSDLKRYFPFSNQSFHMILSSQFLYCIPQQKREKVLQEINRVLKPEGKLIFFESKKYVNWDIIPVEKFFKKLNYDTKIYSLNYMHNKCIFYARKAK
ncbi:MAG TPA: class I SAM-dependent methyltransferase [Candidatus Thermoplasmatota archaeon]|nr:class I SAM-dependent methyltransferase [Candidatus Thermoplasmatota archaeon]